MTAYEIYKKLKEKAEEVTEARQALVCAHNQSIRFNDEEGETISQSATATHWSETIAFFCDYVAYATDHTIERNQSRAVKLLYKDYCALRDELRAMLSAEYDAR